MKKLQPGTLVDRPRRLRLERKTAQATLPTAAEHVYSDVKKVNVISHKFRRSEENESVFELLSCWQKLPTPKQELILGVVKGLVASMTV